MYTRPLPPHFIRLLKIHPDSQPQPGAIQCELSTHLIDNRPPSFSLSYTWGEHGDKKHIMTACKSFYMQKNLMAKYQEGIESHSGD